MALFPFSIADIDDPECIRVVLYASGRMGHAPLNALLKKAYEDITKISKRMDALAKRMDVLEKKLNTLDPTKIEQKKNTKKENQDSINSVVSGGITTSSSIVSGSDIKIESLSAGDLFFSPIYEAPKIDYSSFGSKLTTHKPLEIYSNVSQYMGVEHSRGISSLLEKEK
ncbi:hypothetical protein [Bartonella grahamii]|uniref:Uncharacterized protein n=2 Tax=Bartonella grahamii TaxID=33045 RepID=A0A336NKK3_BARGR|nr:hypothetical protein [Bartonella grahamii]ACS51806.1 hypothetical protein Bgr_16670 [Bartonella grahamii as4aup]SSZ39362.1 Uncharacterised protein [Bartonella grahamii]